MVAEMLEDSIYKFFMVLSFVAAVITVISILAPSNPFSMDPQMVAGYVQNSIGDVLGKIAGQW